MSSDDISIGDLERVNDTNANGNRERKAYALTRQGHRVLEAEVARLRTPVSIAHRRTARVRVRPSCYTETGMEWINKHRNVRQVPVLVLLLLAIGGPWFFTLDGVPPPAWCQDPFFLLANGLCAGSVSAAEILAFIGGGILAMGASLVTGAVAVSDIAAELPRIFLIAMLLLVLVLPILSTLLLVAGRDSRRVRVFYLMTWGMAAVLGLLPVVFDATLRSGRFWGIWLYFGLAAGVLVLEILLFAGSRRLGSIDPRRR